MPKTSSAARPRSKPSTSDRYECCDRLRDLAIDHNEILSIETDFLALVQLVTRVMTWNDSGEEYRDHVSPFVLKDFAADHSWQNPALVGRLMLCLEDAWRSSRNTHVGFVLATAVSGAYEAYLDNRR